MGIVRITVRENKPARMTRKKESVSLTPAMFNILVVLSRGEKHGYAILHEIEEVNEGRTSLGPTSLYRTIRTMLDGGLIKELAASRSADTDDERRRYYKLTAAGIRVLKDEVSRLESLLKVVRSQKPNLLNA